MLDLLSSQPTLRQRLGDAGRAYVEEHFQWPDVLARHESLLEQAVVSFGSPHAQR